MLKISIREDLNMEDKAYEEIKELAIALKNIVQEDINESTELVDNIIKYKIKDEEVISGAFDKMLSIAFAAEEDIKGIYYKLLNYAKKIDKELSEDYEEIFIEQFKDIDEEDEELMN